MRIWSKYLLTQLSLSFFFFLLVIFSFYLLIDLSIHGVRFFSKEGALLEVLLYYGYNFALHLYFFLPLAFLLSCLKILLTLSVHQELTALQMGGLSSSKILAPFFGFATCLILCCFANFEWVTPLAQAKIDTFEKAYAKKPKKEQALGLYSICMADGSDLIYRSFDQDRLEFQDVFWIQLTQDIWHMKFLSLAKTPEGRFVDHFQRNSDLLLKKTESFASISFPELVLSQKSSFQSYLPLEQRKISTLLHQAWHQKNKEKALSAYLHYKLALPFVHIGIILLAGMCALRFSRDKPVFFLTAISLFSFVSFMLFLEAMLILGENEVLPGYLVIWGPFFLLLCCSTVFWRKA